jgi:glycosyltransferase involved in cell wall biosynthesis
LYRLLEIAFLPSRIEGFSQALLEAMALGKPVIASAAGGNLDLVRHEIDGLLVPPLDRAAWAAAIERLLGDAPLAARLGEAARQTARVTFSLDRTVDRTLQLYQSLRAGAPLAPAAPLQ